MFRIERANGRFAPATSCVWRVRKPRPRCREAATLVEGIFELTVRRTPLPSRTWKSRGSRMCVSGFRGSACILTYNRHSLFKLQASAGSGVTASLAFDNDNTFIALGVARRQLPPRPCRAPLP